MGGFVKGSGFKTFRVFFGFWGLTGLGFGAAVDGGRDLRVGVVRGISDGT